MEEIPNNENKLFKQTNISNIFKTDFNELRLKNHQFNVASEMVEI